MPGSSEVHSFFADSAEIIDEIVMKDSSRTDSTMNDSADLSESNPLLKKYDRSEIYPDTIKIDSLTYLENRLNFNLSDSSDTLDSPGILKGQDDINIIEPNVLVFPKRINEAFKPGEKLTFKIRYGIIRAGTATMFVKEELELNNRKVYYIQSTAKSAAAFNWIYKVEDKVVSYLDKEGLFSWKFEKRLREGGYKVDLMVDYDPFQSLAKVNFIRYHSDMTIRKKDNYQVKTTPFILDILAAFYYVRTQELQVGKSIFLTNHDKKKINKLEVKVYKKDIIKVKAGKFRCFVVEPLLSGEGIFKQKGRLKVWLTDDQYKIPVQMKSAVFVGNITTELEKIEGIAGPIPAKK
jgi:hypothetical protein